MRRATGATTTTFRSSRPRPRPLATALLALAALAGCRGVVDPCAPHTGTCIAVEVEADLPSDGPQGVSRLEVTLQLGQSAPVQRTTEPPSGPTGFPLVFPVVLGSYAGTVRLFIVAPEVRLQGQTALSVSQGEHVRVRVVLSSSPATDTSGSDGDQGGPPDGGASIPAARAGGAMAFFPERGTLVLFGGVGDHQRALGDTWEWRDGAWRLLRSSDEAPSARFGAAMAYDSARQVLFLCCGHNGKTVLNDAWQLDAKGRWTRLLDQNAPDSPPARAFAPMAPTPTGTLLLAGGLRPDTSEVLTDVWEYTGRWRQLPLELPTKLRGHALVKTAQELFLIGSDSGGARLQVWIYKAGSSNWTSPPPLSPFISSRRDFAAVYDPDGGVVYIHGGATLDESRNLDETLILDGRGWEWRSLGAGASPARRYAQAAYDPQSKGILLFGGHDGRGALGDTWILRTGTTRWERLTP